MQSKNPVFGRDATYAREARVDDLEAMYRAPAAAAADMRRMTLNDVVMRTATLFGVLLVGAVVGWTYVESTGILLLAMVAGLGLGLVNSFARVVRPGLVLAYGAVEGVFVGGISRIYNDIGGPGTVRNAVLGTMLAFAAMLFVYSSGKLRATPKFTRGLMIAGVAYLGVALVSLVAAMFGVGGGWGLYGMGGLGILLCIAGVAMATLYLILDFDFIERGIRNGAPERESWRAAFGLTVTLVWLYLELLRLLAILNRR